MSYWKRFQVLFISALMIGCSTTPIAVTPEIYHPPLPDPYATCEHVEWEYIITEDSKARPSLSYQHGLDVSLCRDDMIRYLREVNEIIEYYRTQ